MHLWASPLFLHLIQQFCNYPNIFQDFIGNNIKEFWSRWTLVKAYNLFLHLQSELHENIHSKVSNNHSEIESLLQ